MNEQEKQQTDYLSDYLRESKDAQMKIYQQMLQQLERIGECREVYHRLAYVLFNDTLE